MTAVKQVSVASAAHARSLASYLDDGRALARSSQHIVREDRWSEEMAATRAAYGHDRPARAGAKNTVMYHQVLAFNPDECDCNGGKVTPELAMRYASDYVSRRYPDQEAVWVLHRERCEADGTERYAVHIGINRTNLETGRRLDEGRSQAAKRDRAKTVRAMDSEYGLAQMVAGERNSRVHARQPDRAERAQAARGVRTDKQYVREAVAASMREVRASGAQNVGAFRDALSRRGVEAHLDGKGEDLVYRRVKTGARFLGRLLGRGFSLQGVMGGLGLRAVKALAREVGRSMSDEREME